MLLSSLQGGKKPIDLAKYEGQADIFRMLKEAENK